MSAVMSSISAWVCSAWTPSWLTCSFIASTWWKAFSTSLTVIVGIGLRRWDGEQATGERQARDQATPRRGLPVLPVT